MEQLIIFLAGFLATWRISMAVTEEEGPFSVFVRLRSRYPQNSWFGRGIHCLWCVSFWAGIVLGLIVGQSIALGVIYGMAWSSLSGLLGFAFDWLRQRVLG